MGLGPIGVMPPVAYNPRSIPLYRQRKAPPEWAFRGLLLLLRFQTMSAPSIFAILEREPDDLGTPRAGSRVLASNPLSLKMVRSRVGLSGI